MYEKCTNDGGKGDFWCATEIDESSGEMLLGKWGYCNDTCARYGKIKVVECIDKKS